MKQEKSFSQFRLYSLIPEKIVLYLQLIRFESPIGFLLLVWPCWFTLAMFSITDIKLYIFFFLGSFFMRSAGCIINDYVDRYIDRSVERTSNRPLAKGSINLFKVFILLIALLFFSLIILLQFNSTAIVVALASIPLIIIYPLMKRYTYWPQLFLGIIFNWGILVASAQITESIPIQAVLLYIACIFWTLGYDTIYAYQDRKDDIKINLKSTAILFNHKGKFFVMLFYSLFVSFIIIAQNIYNIELINSLILIGILIFLLFFLKNWNINVSQSSNKFFKNNNLVGLIFFAYFLFLF